MPDYKGNLHKLWEVGKRAGIFDKSTTEAQFTERMQGQGYRSQIWRAMPQYNMGFSQLKTFGDFEKAFTNPQLLQQQRAVRYGKGNAAKGGQQAAPTSQATGQQSVAPTQQQAAAPQMVKSKIPSTPYDYSRPFSQRMVDGELLREQNTQNRQSAAAQAQGIANNQLKKIRERNKLVEGVPESIAATQREYADRVAKQAVKDMGIDMSKIAKHGAQESDRKAREYEASQIAKYGVQGTAGMSGFTTAKIANKQRSTEKILDEAIKKGTAGLQQYVNTHKAKIQYDAAAMGMNAVDYVKNVLNPNIANNIAKEVSPYIDEEMMRMYSPTGAGDYIASRILNESVLGQIASFAGTTKEQRQYMQQGLQATREGKNPNGYKPSGTVELAGTALSFVADAPVFAIGGAGANAVASKAVNAVGGKLASKGALGFLSANGEKIGRMVAQGTISGSLNLGAYNAVSSAVSQSSVGDVNLSEIWKSTGSGLLTGGILGVAGVGAQRLTKNWGVSSRKGLVGFSRGAAAKKVAQGAAGAATRFLTEVGAFATASSAEQFLSGEEVTWTDNLAESAGTVVGMKLGGMMQKGVSSVAGGGLKGIANNMRQSLTQLVSDGYHGMKMSATEKRLLLENTNASSLNEALNILSKGGTDAKDTTSAYGKLMADKTIPFDVRQRISLTLTGTAQMSRPRTGYFGIESDMSGERPEERYVMREYSKDGEVLSISSFRTWDEVRESQEAKLAKRNSDWVSGMLAHGALSVRAKDGITPLVRVTDEDLLSPALADERKAFFMSEVLIDNEGNEIHYDPTKGETEGDNALFLEQIKKGGTLYDVYKETMKGMTATELTIMEVAKEHGYTAEKGLDITHRNPLELTAEEGAFMADLSARLHDRIFKKGEPHVEQSAEEGASLADNTGAGVEDNADLTSIKVAIKQELDEATAAFEKVMEGNDVFKSLYEENKDKSPAELMQIFLDSGANDDQFGALVDVLNARAKMQGFLDQTSKNIDMTVQRGVQERSFRGTIDGQPNDSQIIRAVDKSGKEYVIANGAIMTDGAGHITSTDAVICFADDGTLERKVVRGSELTLLEPMDKAAWGEAYREQVQQMWSSRFAEAGIVDVVTEEDKRPSEKTNKTNETAETSEHTIGTSSEEEKQGGLELSEGQKKSIVSQMGEKAEKVRDLELTPENWIAEFGEDGTVETPIGNVKMGDNQYLKLLKKGRSTYFGMVKPTLTNPDLILEEYDPKDGAERDTKYLFVKTFVKADGSRYVHFESVTVQKDNLEVSISSHEINEEALNKKVHQDKLIHLNDKFSSSERRLTEPNEEGSDLVPTPNTNSGGKDTETSATAQENGENNAGGNATAEAARQAETDTAPEWRYDTPEAARQRGFKKIEGVRYDRQGKVSGIMGKVVNVFFHSGSGGNVTGRNTLLELNDIQASHRNGQENPLHFISDAQPKDRRDENSQIAAKNNADAFNPELSASTADSFGAYNNAQPTVNGRGEVIQGNGRMEMFYYVYENAESAAKYKEWLKAHAEELGFSSSDIDKMEKPVLVVVADVDDKRAVELGQKTAADLESGGTRRMDAKRIINAAIAKNKLGTIMRKLFETKEEDATISELLDNNGITVLKWMNQHGIISAEELLTAVKNGRLTEEGKADLRKVVENFLFEGGDNSLRDAYENLPAATKKALLSTLWKSVAAKENGEKARRFIQESIVAFNELLNDEHFKNARNEKEVRVAIADWKKEVDFISGKHSEKFTNFAVELAARYKFYKQRDLTRLMGEFLDSMAPDEEQSFVPKEVLDITEAAKQYFGLTDIYGEKKNGEERPTTDRGGGDVKPVSESGSTSSPQGEPVSPAVPASGERTAAGTGTTERRARSGNGRIKPTTAEDAAKDLTARRGKGEKIDTGVTEDDVRKRIEAIRKRRAQQSKPQQPKGDGTMPALTIEDEQDVREIAKYCLGNGNQSFEDFARAIHESLSGVIDDIDNCLVSTYMGLKFNPDVPKELRDKMDITNAMRYGNDEKAFKEFINQIDKGNEEEKGDEGRISGETPVAGGNEIPVGESMGPGLGHELGRPVAGERPRGGDPSGAGRGISGELGESGHPDGGNDKPKSDAGYKHQDDKKESSPSDSELNGGVGGGTSQPDTGSVPSDVHTGAAEGGIGAGRTNATNVGDEKDIHPEGGEKNSGDHGRTLEAGDKATAERSGSGAQGTGLAGGERMGSPVGTGTANDSGRNGEQPTNTRVQSQLTSDYSPYEAHGGGATEEERTSTQDIIIPTKIAASVSKVLQGIKDIKGFVAKKLGFSDTVALSKVLSPVQVDGVALAIKEVEKGGSVVIGDDTGVGKGRQAAAVISYAHKQGKIPVFFTAKKDLLSDIYRDLRDIGEGGLRPFIVSGSKEAAMKDEDGNVVWNIPSEKELNAFYKTGVLPKGYDCVVLPYSSYTGSNSKLKEKGTLPKLLSGDTVLVMDESHTVSSNADFRGFVENSKNGVVFLSATSSKRPEHLIQYILRKGINESGMSAEDVLDVIKRGGTALQEAFTQMLAKSGGYIRRERNQEGVEVEWEKADTTSEAATVAKKKYDDVIDLYKEIAAFEKDWVGEVLQIMTTDPETRKIRGMVGVDVIPYVEPKKIKNSAVSGRLFNLTQQALLSIKADHVADRAIEQWKKGLKPVIALHNTNEGLFKAPAGGAMEKGDLSVVLERMLTHSALSTSGEMHVDDNQMLGFIAALGGQSAYDALLKKIRAFDSGLTVSPIDHIRERLEAAGMRVGELTGRATRINTTSGKPMVESRSKEDRDKKAVARKFNNGEYDVLILNESSATGISLHASETFADKRQRVMIIAQPQLDVNVEKQVRGRIDRTGQVVRGKYIYVQSPIGTENRQMSMLRKKFTSLNAQTKATGNDNDIDAYDLDNSYGEQAALQAFRDNPEIYQNLSKDLFGWIKDGEFDPDAADPGKVDINEVLKQIQSLRTSEQEEIYNAIFENYKEIVDYHEKLGDNELHTQSLPLEAETIAVEGYTEGANPKSDNLLAQDSRAEYVRMKNLRKPYPWRKVLDEAKKLGVTKTRDPEAYEHYVQDIVKKAKAYYEARRKEMIDKVIKQKLANLHATKIYQTATPESQRRMEQDAVKSAEEDKKVLKFRNEMYGIYGEDFSGAGAIRGGHFGAMVPGGFYSVPYNLEKPSQSAHSFGMFLGFKYDTKNMRGAGVKAVFAVADSRRIVEISLRHKDTLAMICDPKTNRARDFWDDFVEKHRDLAGEDGIMKPETVWEGYVATKSGDMRDGIIITGNIVAAWHDPRTARNGGTIVQYTDDKGNIKIGILLGDEAVKERYGAGKAIITAEGKLQKRGDSVRDSAGHVKITVGSYDITLEVNYLDKTASSKKSGAVDIWRDKKLKELLKDDSNYGTYHPKRGGHAYIYFSPQNLHAVLVHLNDAYKLKYNEETAGEKALRERFGFKIDADDNTFESTKRKMVNGFGALAKILNLPDDAISLYHELTLTVRDRENKEPRALAYYNRTSRKLWTRPADVSSLGHEWFHALDDYFAKLYAGASERYGKYEPWVRYSRQLATEGSLDPGGREEIASAYGQLVKALNTSGFLGRMKAMGLDRYWTSVPEMTARAFESYIKERYFEKYGEEEAMKMWGDKTSGMNALLSNMERFDRGKYGVYPTKEEMTVLRPAFDNLFNSIKTTKSDIGGGRTVLFRLGDEPATFEERQKKAVENKGTVMAGLNEAEVKVVDVPRHEYKGTAVEAKQQAITDATKRYNGKTLHYDNHGAKFDYTISDKSIDESMNSKAIAKSSNMGAHIAVLNQLDKVIGESIEVEEHPDYKKKDGVRNPESGINAKALVHRFIGAVNIGGETYRVKTTMIEHRDKNHGNKEYSYEVTSVELLEEKSSSSSNGVSNVSDVFVTGAKLLQGVEKSYEKGKKLLDESEKSNTNSGKTTRFRTSQQLFAEYPTWLSGQTTSTGQHTTQITSTVASYRKIGEHLLSELADEHKPSKVSVLDASSGLGVGTHALREMGFDVEDVEPYPSEKREAPTYRTYEEVSKKYDVVISNAVLNVIPDDWRADVLKNMADKLKVGGRLFINVRDAAGVKAQKQKIELDEPSEILVTDKQGNIRAYQKGFTKQELADYVKKQLGDGFEVETATAKNSGMGGATAVVVTRKNEAPVRYRSVRSMLDETPKSRAIRTHVTRLSEKLGGERFEIIEDADHIEDEEMQSYIEQMHERGKRVPGWYDVRTGKVHLLMSDVRSRYDAERTILHETVGHKGMRHLLGENGYRKYMNMLWRDKSLTGLHEWVNDRMTKNGYDLYTAIDEYIAESAEGLAHKEGLGFWQKVRNAISTVLHEIGYRFSPNIKDVKYMTWLAKHEMSRGDVMSEAKRQSLLRKINAETLEEPTSRDDRRFVDKEASEENVVAARSEDEEIPDSSVRLRAADEELHDDDTPIAAYKKMKYERSMQENRKRWEEGHLDNMTAYRELEKALVGDDVLKDSENAYWAENHMSSIVEEVESHFANQQMKKLHGAVKRVMTAFTGNKKEKLRQVNDYIYTKTGLERNRVLEVRDFVRELREVSVAQLEGDVQRMRHIETLSDAEVAEMANHPTKLGTFLQGMKGMKIPSTLKQAVKNMPSSWVSNPSLLRDELNKIDSNIPNARMKWKHIASARYYKTQNPQDNRSEVEIATEEVTTAWKNTKSFSDKELDARNIGADEYFDGLDQFVRDEISEDYDAGKRDKSGLSAMDENTPNGEYDDAEMIRKMMDNEDMIGNGDVDALWQAIRDCTQFSLDYDYNSGLHSKNVHDKLADEFHWYVPLRGFEEPTAGDMYDYMHSDIGFNMAGKSIVMNADGRKSKADEIIPMIGLMASNAIRRGERNKVKQRMLNLVRHYNDPNNPKSNLVSVSRAWATKHIVDGKEVWEMEQPDIPEGATGDEIAQIVNDFNDRMKTLQANGDAKIVRERSNMQYRATAKQKNEHVVDVCVNGEHYYLTVNGDPRAAQAINGALGGVNSGVMGKINRFISAAFTSYSPTFMVTNTSRDFQEALVNLTVKEGGQYVARFEKNYATAINNIVRRGELWKEYRAGTIGQSVNRKGKSKNAADMRLERYFKEFLDNGGKTGHIEVKNLDKYKDELVQKVREKKVTPKHILQLVGGAIEHMNERAENAARFATYLTSRELGRSVLRSVHDAKEVTVNFNRKGSGIKAASGWTPEGGVQFKASYAKEAIKKAATLGKYDMGKEASSYWAGVTAEFPRQAYLFWNAGMQDLAMKYRIAKKSPAKFVGGMVIGYAAAGAMMAVINNALANWLDDEDYSNKYSPYANLPEWMRRNNICIYLGKKQGFLKIPIPIFLRGFYGIGDIAAGYLYDENLKSIDSSLAEDVAGQITQMLPLDFLGEGNSALDAAVPDFAKPLAQNITGKDWTGKPLERQNMWDENAPKWTRAYKSENKITVGITKKLNDLTNGDAPASVKSGWINLSPAEIDNLISGYTGGAGSAIAEVAALGRAALKADFKDIDSHDVPIIKAFIQTPSDRTANFRLRTKFYKAVDDARETKHMLSRAKADLSDPYTYAWYLKHAKDAEQQKAIKILRASKMISKLNKVINDPVSEDERKGAEAAKIEWMNYALSEAQSE